MTNTENNATVLVCGTCGFGTYHWREADLWECNACDHLMHLTDFELDAGEYLDESGVFLAVVHAEPTEED